MATFHRELPAEMYKDLTDEDRIAENRIKADRKKRVEDRRSDAGL